MYEFVDIFSLEEDMWEFIAKPVLALIFLYEIKDMHREVIKLMENQDDADALLEAENPFYIP